MKKLVLLMACVAILVGYNLAESVKEHKSEREHTQQLKARIERLKAEFDELEKKVDESTKTLEEQAKWDIQWGKENTHVLQYHLEANNDD